MSDGQDKTRMHLGVWIGHKLENIPKTYLLWYTETHSPDYANQHVHDYVKEKLKPEIKP